MNDCALNLNLNYGLVSKLSGFPRVCVLSTWASWTPRPGLYRSGTLSSWLDWTELQGQCAMENPQDLQLVVEKKVLAIRTLHFDPRFCSFQGAKGSKGLADRTVGEDS